MSNFLIRCDVSPAAGLGHFSRCLALAKELKSLGAAIFFACRLQDFEMPEEARISCTEWLPLNWSITPAEDARQVINLCKRYQIDIAIVDHYRIDSEYQRKLHQSGIRWLQFDGRAQQPLWADWVLNPRLDVKISDYLPLRQRPETQFFLGPAYAFLRREFGQRYKQVCFNKQVNTILLTFGGGDDRGAIVFCLEATGTLFPGVNRVVLTTSKNPRNGKILQWMRNSTVNSELIVDEPEIAKRMAEADIGIISGGMTTFEATAMGLPCLIVQIAENQKLNAQAWHAAGVSINLGSLEALKSELLYQQVRDLIERPERRQKLYAAGRSLVDCQGAQRVARELLDQCKQ